MRKGKLFVITAVMAAALAVPAHAASVGSATVISDTLNLRISPSTSADILTTAVKDAPVIVGDNSNAAWYKVVCHGYTGYMSANSLNFTEAAKGDFGYGKINGTNIHLKKAPDTLSDVVGTYQSGVIVQILGVTGGWYKVQIGNDTGYIHSDYIAVTPDVNTVIADDGTPASPVCQTVVDTAMQYLGCPYVYGGSSPKGFDCSGFVKYVYDAACGIETTRSAASIYSADGVSADRSALQPGDVLCFSNGGQGIGHVGIYIGNGQFIHACNSTTGVIVSELSMDYWNRHYVGAKRLLQ